MQENLCIIKQSKSRILRLKCPTIQFSIIHCHFLQCAKKKNCNENYRIQLGKIRKLQLTLETKTEHNNGIHPVSPSLQPCQSTNHRGALSVIEPMTERLQCETFQAWALKEVQSAQSQTPVPELSPRHGLAIFH